MKVSQRRLAAAGWGVASLVLIGLCLTAVGWQLSGGRWYDVLTPSMGRALPVGTLVLTRPVLLAHVHIGEIITFRAPGSGHVYTHRVVSLTAHGLRTRGDNNLVADPWLVTQGDLIGRVSNRWWACGWLLRGIPLFGFVVALVWLVTIRVRRHVRAALRIAGAALAAAISAYVLSPWIGLERLGSGPVARGIGVRVVSVGVLPTRATARHGSSVHLVDGQVATVALGGTSHRYDILASPSLSFLWWVVVVLVCLSPLLWTSIVGLPPPGGRRRPRHDHLHPGPDVRLPAPAMAAIALLAGTALVGGVPHTHSGLQAAVSNTADSVVSAGYYTCTAAVVGGGAYSSWPLADAAGLTATDVSGNNHPGTYTAVGVTYGQAGPCPRDQAKAATFDGLLGSVTDTTGIAAPTQQSDEIWFKTTTTGGGLLIGSYNATIAGTGDRVLYLNSSGQLSFGVNNGTARTISSTAAYNDGRWHLADGVLSTTAGTALYVDGALVASSSTTTAGSAFTAYTKVALGSLTGWPNIGGVTLALGGLNATLAYATIFRTPLSAARVAADYRAGT